MRSIREVIVVEGRYDKNALKQVVNATVVETGGFGVFNDKERLALLRRMAAQRGLIILTDSDGAGKLIRSHITSALPREKIIQLYIPQIEGKERRKTAPSAEGTLGVEGMEVSLLRELLAPYENDEWHKRYSENPITKADLYADGLGQKRQLGSTRRAL